MTIKFIDKMPALLEAEHGKKCKVSKGDHDWRTCIGDYPGTTNYICKHCKINGSILLEDLL